MSETLPNATNRYDLCTVPRGSQTLYGFPMNHDGDTYRVAYHSNMGDIKEASDAHLLVDMVLLVVHGSERNVENYFCAALSLLQHGETAKLVNRTLIVAPLFAAPDDGPLLDNILQWEDRLDENHLLAHSWRYGADALNAPISSYDVLDSLVEYLVAARVQYPNIKRIAIAGHSAGAQVSHRWALLSNSMIWSVPTLEIVSVVANPRSYCYLDARRISIHNGFNIPDSNQTRTCSGYNEWQWGLDDGGKLNCPYRDRALLETPAKFMAKRYASRNVVYLSGSLDNLPTRDRCETTEFQGMNRQERAKNYYLGLEFFFGYSIHSFHLVEGSPHDHTLMFQSPEGRHAIFGKTSNTL
eukprot:Nitzschia sp. Nitz4//scaffold248_size28759//17396//18460//NITZ4_008110-RA/size28759-processed-gene-0.17-mRNA-1//-1//CDS//3329543995//1266//frame0